MGQHGGPCLSVMCALVSIGGGADEIMLGDHLQMMGTLPGEKVGSL